MSTTTADPFITSEYGILQVITGHEADVRAVNSYPEGGVLSASRDKLAKLFMPADKNNPHCELNEVQSFVGPNGVAAAICCGKTKSGDYEIYVASHDTNIFVYNIIESKPIATLARHSSEVCTLAFRVCNDQDILVSGSWDQTAIIWTNREPTVTLYGHVHAVWDVAFVARSFILTAGADKTIRKWNIPDGQLLNIFEGHTDCVRSLAVINGQQFLSSSNDATIIMWTINGDILKRFEGHENFIYSICIVRQPLKPGQEPPKNRPYKIVSVSEDKTVRIWDKDSGCLQKIPIQTSTIWSVAALDNGNFAVGTSDGFVYVFAPVKPDGN
jgi:phospholipase A-2-activating protein